MIYSVTNICIWIRQIIWLGDIQSSKIVGEITNKYSREYQTTIYVFTNAKININKRIEEIKEEKNYNKK
ncbi:MAG: hypothetical protein ABI554_09925 [Flavobacterium sp.]